MSDLMLDLGGKGALVATVQRYSGQPHEAISLGSFLHPSLEKIFVVRPDWILTDDSVPMPPGRARWEELGTRTAVLAMKTVRDLGRSADRMLGEVLGSSKRIGSVLELCLAKVSAQTPPNGTVLIFVSTSPPFLAAHSSFLSSLAETAGHRNLAEPQWTGAYPLVTEEWLIAHRPDRVYILDHGFGELPTAQSKIRQWWPDPPRLHTLPAEPFAKASLHVLTRWEPWRRMTPPECKSVF